MTCYGDLPEAYSDKNKSAAVIVPVPYDNTSTWIKGADKGPQALIEASANMELYDIETGTEVYKYGIYTDVPVLISGRPELMIPAVKERIHSWMEMNKFVITIGGEHSITIGSVAAHLSKYPDLSVLQLDAHTDLRPEYLGSKYNHACTMSRIQEFCPITQVGIRSMDIIEKDYIKPDRVFFAEEIIPSDGWIEEVVQTLNNQIYLTIDLDVFDPSVMPSTGTPEPGGLDWYRVLELLRRVIEKKELMGFDIVELCPDTNNKAPDFLASKLLYKILTYKFLKNKKSLI
jgi:N1-aminopropylagmatine ureohydrolase